MKIISKYKQPYDNVQWYCEDNIVWRRSPVKYTNKRVLDPSISNLILRRIKYICQENRHNELHGWIVVGNTATPIATDIKGNYVPYTFNGFKPTEVKNELSPIILATWPASQWSIRSISITTDVEFSKDSTIWSIIQPADTSQKIFSCLANKVCKENDTLAEVPNDIRLQQHGFDLKTSFRGK